MNPSDLPDDPNQALIVLMGVMVLAVVGALTFAIRSRNSAAVGTDVRAVVKRIEDDVAKLVAAELDFQSRGWTTLPPDLASSAGLTAAIRDIQHDVRSLTEKLRAHDEWERSQKYKE